MNPLHNKCCVDCNSSKISVHQTYSTKSNGIRKIYYCQDCLSHFSETKNTPAARIRTSLSRVSEILLSRAEGLGFNAACRVFKIGRSTLKNWEEDFSSLIKVLMLYSYAHKFFQLIIEGDEMYTKIAKNVAPDLSEGWIIVLLDRSSRFIFTMKCGKRDQKLFKKVMAEFLTLAKQTDDLTLVTDGERRYGNILFEICNEVIRTGRRGRPKKTLRQGIRIGIKNKGSQKKKKGRKRPKYQQPWEKHPKTPGEIRENDIHANHLEAQNASIRRKCSPCRRKTNTYSKTTKGLQRVLDIQHIIHNFIRSHYTTKIVPAVKIGILSTGMTMIELLTTKIS